jgi:hypothetical protein
VSWSFGHAAKNQLIPATPLALDSIDQEAFLANYAHIDQGTLHAGRQKLLTQTRQRRCLSSAEQVRRDCKVELIDQALFQ